MIAQHGIQRPLILTNQRTGAAVLMPIPVRRKEFADGYDKNARFSVRIRIVFCMSPSYSLDALASRGRAGIFDALPPKPGQPTGTTAGCDTNYRGWEPGHAVQRSDRKTGEKLELA
jgi:hypothetical protein